MKTLFIFLLGIPEKFMLPCLNKKFFGIDCPGCGMQRAVSLLLQGEFTDAFYMYPAIYTLIPLAGIAILNYFTNLKYLSKLIMYLGIISVVIILTSYTLKFI